MSESRLSEHQFTREEAIKFAQQRKWESLTPKERGLLQMRQDRLCMDFSVFHAGVTELLGRPVFTHEFARPDELWAEYLTGETIDFAAVLAKIPAHLGVIVATLDDAS